jgi:hypothetical protein
MSVEQMRLWLAEEEKRADERTLAEVAAMVRLGLGTLQSQDRTVDAHRRRCVAAWVLVYHYHWPVKKMAQAFNRTERQAWNLLATQRTASRRPKKPNEPIRHAASDPKKL